MSSNPNKYEIEDILKINQPDLVLTISLKSSVLGEILIQKDVIQKYQLDNIKAETQPLEQNRQLLTLVEKLPWEKFLRFSEALVVAGYGKLVEPWPDDAKQIKEYKSNESIDALQVNTSIRNASGKDMPISKLYKVELEKTIKSAFEKLRNTSDPSMMEKQLKYLETLYHFGVVMEPLLETGSLVWHIQFTSVFGLDQFWVSYNSGEIQVLMSEFMLNAPLREKYNLSGTSLIIHVAEENYLHVRKQLKAATLCEKEELENLRLDCQRKQNSIEAFEAEISGLKAENKFLKEMMEKTKPALKSGSDEGESSSSQPTKQAKSTETEPATRVREHVQSLQTEEEYPETVAPFPHTEKTGTMVGYIDHSKVIEKNMVYMIDNISLKTTNLWEMVVEEGIISVQDFNYIKECNLKERDQVRQLLTYLCKGSYDNFVKFLEVLRATKQEHVAERLESSSG